MKVYFIYKEFDDEFGYKEKIYITRIFENVEQLLKYIIKRKEFYKPNTRKIEIEILGDKENE